MTKTTARRQASRRGAPRARSQGGSRRRYEVASAGLLWRLRAQPARGRGRESAQARQRGLALAVLSLALVLIGTVLWVALDDRFYVYQVTVVGNHRTAADDVFWASDLPGVHVLWARPGRAARLIAERLPNIERASVACGLPANCTITIVERQPRLVWEEESTVWWVDADGVVMPPQGLLSDGWVVRGPLPLAGVPEPGAEGSGDAGQQRLDEQVRIALNELWRAGLDSTAVFQYVPGRGLVWADPRGWRVVLGEGPGMTERLQVATWLGDSLQARGLKPRFVDVRFPTAPYYSLTNEW